ncbi:hypothetical protein N0V94_009432 [Neodidymelliopsis sp. IMI 364377]|nr:hypothetical protein N0V94_009432 [Neodidymelliopsis sp. IMI 364377]
MRYGLDQLLSELKNRGIEVGGEFAKEPWSSQIDTDCENDDNDEDDAEDFEQVEVDDKTGQELYLASLRDKVLDRLAEVLARFKTEREGHKGPFLDPKHVSAAMTVIYDHPVKVKICCAKNEGLTQKRDGKPNTEDTVFLETWKKHMQCIAEKVPAATDAKTSLFTLIVEYQRPKVVYYLRKLHKAFTIEGSLRKPKQHSDTELSEESLKKVGSLRPRIWFADNDNEFKIPVNSATADKAAIETAVACSSSMSIGNEVNSMFDKVVALCKLGMSTKPSVRFTALQISLLQEIMAINLHLWKSMRHRSAIKTYLHNRFWNMTDRHKERALS